MYFVWRLKCCVADCEANRIGSKMFGIVAQQQSHDTNGMPIVLVNLSWVLWHSLWALTGIRNPEYKRNQMGKFSHSRPFPFHIECVVRSPAHKMRGIHCRGIDIIKFSINNSVHLTQRPEKLRMRPLIAWTSYQSRNAFSSIFTDWFWRSHHSSDQKLNHRFALIDATFI